MRSQDRMDLAEANRKVTSGAASMACKFTASGLLRKALKGGKYLCSPGSGGPRSDSPVDT